MNSFFIDFDVFLEFHHLAISRAFQTSDFSVLELVSFLIRLSNIFLKNQRAYLVDVLTQTELILLFFKFAYFAHLPSLISYVLVMLTCCF